MEKVKIFCSTRNDGIMSSQSIFHGDKPREQVIAELKDLRMKYAAKVGFDGTKIIVPLQKGTIPGHLEDATERVEEYCREGLDLWDVPDIVCDVMTLNRKVKGVALGFPVADCIVLLITTPKFIGICHCGVSEIDRGLPSQAIDAIQEFTKEKDENIQIKIGPYAHRSSLEYDKFPNWLIKNPDMWTDFIEETPLIDIKTGERTIHYRVGMLSALISQLENKHSKIIENNFIYSSIDTVTDPRYFSHSAARLDPSKEGRHLEGIVVIEEKGHARGKSLY